MSIFSHLSKWRALLAATCFVSTLIAPPWAPFLIALALAARWRAWEIVFIGVWMDLLWMPFSASVSWGAVPYATLVAWALVLAFEPVRKRLLA